jgi:hypothetical protein
LRRWSVWTSKRSTWRRAAAESASVSDLRVGECLRANGPADAAGLVQATAIAITPAGPSGTCATAAGGRGFGGAGGGQPAGGAPPG